jgi:ribose 5-phosphate isomerase B
MRIAFGTDEDTSLTVELREVLVGLGHEVIPVASGAAWPEVGRGVGEAVASGVADRGIVCCWTGTGVSIAANKVPGVRAALCGDAPTVIGARRWNDANVLALSLRLTSPAVARELLGAFLDTPVDPGEGTVIARVDARPGGDQPLF